MKKIKVQLVKSPAGCPERQKKTVKGMGLYKLNSTRELQDTPAIRGMVRKVHHLVSIVEEK